jgi:aryl-alcohol dehydrogenase-like predicted oxidoreductase
MDAFEHRLEAGHTLLESALARGINYWDTGRSYGPSEGMIAPVLDVTEVVHFWLARFPGLRRFQTGL